LSFWNFDTLFNRNKVCKYLKKPSFSYFARLPKKEIKSIWDWMVCFCCKQQCAEAYTLCIILLGSFWTREPWTVKWYGHLVILISKGLKLCWDWFWGCLFMEKQNHIEIFLLEHLGRVNEENLTILFAGFLLE
jgi:hypothetical protein